MEKITKEHIQKKTITETWVVPTHKKRNTKLFNRCVKQLKKDGNYYDLVTYLRTGEKITKGIEVHHICEFSEENNIDFEIAKRFLKLVDAYGYNYAMKDTPLTCVDDLRNMICLKKCYHTGKNTGIHLMTFDLWVLLIVSKIIPVVDEAGEEIIDVFNQMKGSK